MGDDGIGLNGSKRRLALCFVSLSFFSLVYFSISRLKFWEYRRVVLASTFFFLFFSPFLLPILPDTPLWRNGPPDKPVLCNACGSRWRTKGSLTNYTPLHARGPLEHLEEPKVPKERSITFKTREQKMYKVKENNGNRYKEHDMIDYDQNFHKGFDEDTSNRSSSGSAVSYSESCSHFGGTDVSDVTGSLQTNTWDPLVPSKKRTGAVRPKASSVEKLTKDLYSIWHQQSSYLSGLSEEELLYESSSTLKGSVEIGNGSVLIRHPNSVILEEESEASSLLIENKFFYSDLPVSVNMQSKELIFPNSGNGKNKKVHAGQEHMKRDGLVIENSHFMRDRHSPWGFVDLNDLVNIEVLMKHLTHEDQQHLLRFLPPIDTLQYPESFISMCASDDFQEALSCYQMLLQEGLFDLSFSEVDGNECISLERLGLLNLTKSPWLEHHKMIKVAMHERSLAENAVGRGMDLISSSSLASLKRQRDVQNQHFQEMSVSIKRPKKMWKNGGFVRVFSGRSSKVNLDNAEMKSAHVKSDYMENAGSHLNHRSLITYPPDKSSMLETLQFTDEMPEQDLLLNVRSNSSFPEAELLTSVWKAKAPNSNSMESRVSEKEDGLSCPSSSSTSKQQCGRNHIPE